MTLREQMIQTIVNELKNNPVAASPNIGRYVNFVQYLYEEFHGPCSNRAERRKAMMYDFQATDAAWLKFGDEWLLQTYDLFSINRWKQR